MRAKAVIVDDEQLICNEIEYLLTNEPDVELIGKFTNSTEALSFISRTACDIVFLDIKMPGISGLNIAQKLTFLRHPPLIVFITAFREHALEAFETPAVGYITKPVTENKLAKVLEKIRVIRNRPDTHMTVVSNKICVMASGKIIPLNKQDVVFVYVRDKDVYIRTKNAEYAAALTLQEIEQMLPGDNFLRVHRQFLVNLDMVLEIIPWFHGSFLLRMDDYKKEEVPVSRTKIKLLKTLMGLR